MKLEQNNCFSAWTHIEILESCPTPEIFRCSRIVRKTVHKSPAFRKTAEFFDRWIVIRSENDQRLSLDSKTANQFGKVPLIATGENNVSVVVEDLLLNPRD